MFLGHIVLVFFSCFNFFDDVEHDIVLERLNNSLPFIVSSLEVTVDQDHLIHFMAFFVPREEFKILGIAKEPLTFAVKILSLNVQEVVFLIHNIFINL